MERSLAALDTVKVFALFLVLALFLTFDGYEALQ
jgi:hypothetical protein